MQRKNRIIDDDALPVMVPRNLAQLVAMPSERVAKLRAHLDQELADLRRAKRPERFDPHESAEPTGFAARVAATACSLCKGSCCRNGGDHAFLGERALARVRLDHPGISDDALRQHYLDRVPAESYQGSCIFHGREGCTLDRSMRTDVCNQYFCGGLIDYMKAGEPAMPTMVLAGGGKKMRRSPVLIPAGADAGKPAD
jgi:hypothetical protein